jgi:hypothetical protein
MVVSTGLNPVRASLGAHTGSQAAPPNSKGCGGKASWRHMKHDDSIIKVPYVITIKPTVITTLNVPPLFHSSIIIFQHNPPSAFMHLLHLDRLHDNEEWKLWMTASVTARSVISCQDWASESKSSGMFWKIMTLRRNDWATFHIPLTSDAVFMACGTFLIGHPSSQPDIWLKSVGIRDEISARTSRIESGSAAKLTAKLQMWFLSCQWRRFWGPQLAWLAGSCRTSYWQTGNRGASEQHGRSHDCCSECEELHTHSPIRMQSHVLRALHMRLVFKTADSGQRSVIV